MTTLITNIKQLVNVTNSSNLVMGNNLSNLPTIEGAFLLIEEDKIVDYGKEINLSATYKQNHQVIDAQQATILPTYCDSHTHVVFAATREEEFIDKIKGLSYADIAAKGGGILNSAAKLAMASENDLYDAAYKRIEQLIQLGTGAVEIKSGYGLTVDAELKMLRVIKALKQQLPIPIKATFLGAHTYPLLFKQNHEAYIGSIINEMLPAIAAENLADFIDVFCEDGFFNVNEMFAICQAGLQHNLQPKLHVNQLNSIGGLQKGVALNALSLDHLETLTTHDISFLQQAYLNGYKGLCTLLPTAAFFLRMNYQPARALIDAGCAIALASDYNPGSSPSGNMNFVNALSCIQLKMLPEEVINASTINGAFAMQLQHKVGSITKGKQANLIFTKPIPSLAYMMYSFGENVIDKVMINGKFYN